jgi:MoaA/NifB/PqqE/SkfB family radical SAM enzyme
MLMDWQRLSQKDVERIANGIVENRVCGGPFHLEIQPTDVCNLNCFFCSSERFRRGRSIPWDTLRAVLEEAAARDLRFLRLSGGGESLAYHSIGPLLDLCAQKGLRISDLTTNGTLLAPLVPRLMNAGVDFVSISLNEPCPAHYAESMRTSEQSFRKAIQGVEAVCAARDSAPHDGRPVVAVQFFFWRNNRDLLPDMYRFAVERGTDQVIIKSLLLVESCHRIPAEEYPAIKERILQMIEEDSRSGRYKLRFELCGDPELHLFAHGEQRRRLPEGLCIGPSFVEQSPRRQFCFMPWYNATIAATGVVYPCCPFVGMPTKEMGNVLRNPISDIWAGRPFQVLRSMIRRIMVLGGDMEFSRKYHRCIEPFCIHRFGCGFGYYLCSDDFYRQIGERLEHAIGPLERWSAGGRNLALRAAHRVLRYLRSR